jgi:hypothetical protein
MARDVATEAFTLWCVLGPGPSNGSGRAYNRLGVTDRVGVALQGLAGLGRDAIRADQFQPKTTTPA